MSESSSDEDLNLTSTSKLVQADQLRFLPEKSREKYIKAYDVFEAWRHSKGGNTLSEALMLSYFIEQSETKKSSSLWSIYSMLKATFKTKDNIHIEKYSKLLAFLKNKATGHKPTKSKTFTAANIEQFLNEAHDSEHLATKVVLIIGISGACRTKELTYLTTKNIEKHSERLLLVTKPNTDRNFVIRNEYVKIVEKYQALRPANTPIDRFFLQYRKGKCVKQPMGCNKVGGLPREIAAFLGLPEPEKYTGHCFRRTSASLLTDSGVDLATLKSNGDRKPSTVVGGYIVDSIENKSEICKGIVEGKTLKQSWPDPSPRPSTSKDNTIEIKLSESSADLSLPPPFNMEFIEIDRPSTCEDSPIEIKRSDSPADPSVPPSPPFTMEFDGIDQYSANLPTNSTQVTNTNITVPKKNLTLNISNCSNVTFNFKSK